MLVETFVALAALAAGEVRGAMGGGGPVVRPAGAGDCVPAELRARIAALLAARAPAAGAPKQLAAAPLLPAAALGGIAEQDIVLGNLVDLDPTFGIRDYSCHDFTYDGHAGHDIGLRSFEEQSIGVPVFAVRGGTVAFAQDGSPDMNTMGSTTDAGNYVIIDHGDGTFGWYYHLRKNSVAFTVGQPVVAGQQVGLAGSSGNSFGPHLHFGLSDVSSNPIEPYSGVCNPPASSWAHQEPLNLEPFFFDFGATTTDLFSIPQALPFALPVDAQIPLNAGFVYYWFQGGNLAPHSTWRWIFERPNGTVAYDSLAQSFGNPTFQRLYWMFFYFWIPDMQTTVGTWHVKVEFNGKQVVDAPVDVVANVVPGFNRAPEPIGVAFDPPSPSPGELLFCRVNASVCVDDLDWDLVRYHYTWKVNGAVVRDLVSAGRSDALPVNAFQAGDVVRCEVTPSDGVASGPTATVFATAATERWTNLGKSKYGGPGVPYLEGTGPLSGGSSNAILLSQAKPSSLAYLFLGAAAGNVPLLGGTLVPFPLLLSTPLFTSASGGITLPFTMPAGIPPGAAFVLQAWVQDAGAILGASASNGLRAITP